MPLPPLSRRPRTFEAVSKQPLVEAAVTSQIKDFFVAKGWRPIRYQRTVMPGQFSTAEPGMADFGFNYYLPSVRSGLACVVWIEVKREGARLYCRCVERAAKGKKGKCTPCLQADWRKREELRGALFGPGDSIELLMSWYAENFAWLHNGTVKGQQDLFA